MILAVQSPLRSFTFSRLYVSSDPTCSSQRYVFGHTLDLSTTNVHPAPYSGTPPQKSLTGLTSGYFFLLTLSQGPKRWEGRHVSLEGEESKVSYRREPLDDHFTGSVMLTSTFVSEMSPPCDAKTHYGTTITEDGLRTCLGVNLLDFFYSSTLLV